MKLLKKGLVLLAAILLLAGSAGAADRMVVGEMFTNTY